MLRALKASASAMVVGPFWPPDGGGTQGALALLPLRRRGDAEPNESIVFAKDFIGRARRDGHGITDCRQAGLMAHRYRRLLLGAILTLLVAIGSLLGGVGPLRRMAWAALHAPDRLPTLAEDPRIRYEPGAENLARSIAAGLPGAVATIERVQGRPFKRVCVYAFISSDSFTAYGAAGGG
jgi:hypothetical protein